MKKKIAPGSNWKALQAVIEKDEKTTKRKATDGHNVKSKRFKSEKKTTAVSGKIPKTTQKEELWFTEELNDQAKRHIHRTQNHDAREKLKAEQLLQMESVAGEKAAAGRYVAIDCEMVETGERLPDGSFRKKKSELARVSLVNYFGAVLLDVFVKPQRPITDYRTEVSGIRPKDLKNAMPFLEAQQKVLDIVQDRIMVGHAIIHDLSALRIKHPRYLIRDTSKYKPFFEYNNGRTPGLKTLVDCVLDMEIQSGEHSSVEDARFTMLLYRHAKEEWEKAVGAQYGLKMKQFFEKARQREEKERRRLENKANIERKKVKQQLKEAKQQQKKKRKADDDSSSSSSNSSSEDESSEEEADESDDDQDDSE